MLLQDLEKRGLIKPPTWLVSNTCYLTRMGSVAYGVSSDNSDLDIYGVVIPPRDYIFPQNYIHGYDNRDLTFHQWQDHHVEDKSANSGKGCMYDFKIYSIVNFFHLAAKNDVAVIDSLFVKRECIMHSTPMWEIIKDNRKLFLHKGVVHKLKSYGFSQINKAKNCVASLQPILEFEKENGISHSTTFEQAQALDIRAGRSRYMELWAAGINKTSRFEQQKIHQMDCKFMYHVYRLVDQAEYILNHHDLDLQESGRVEKMKAIRRGDIPFEDIIKYFGEAEIRLSNIFESSTLQKYPPEKEIRALLISSLESHYGSLKEFLKENNAAELAINEIKASLRKYSL